MSLQRKITTSTKCYWTFSQAADNMAAELQLHLLQEDTVAMQWPQPPTENDQLYAWKNRPVRINKYS